MGLTLESQPLQSCSFWLYGMKCYILSNMFAVWYGMKCCLVLEVYGMEWNECLLFCVIWNGMKYCMVFYGMERNVVCFVLYGMLKIA